MEMAENAMETQRVFCDFCKKFRMQVGELTCRHRMCANCFPYFSKKLENCYLCVLATAEIKRNSMKIIRCSVEDDSSDTSGGEKFFCSNNSCDFVGTTTDLFTHKVVCDLKNPADAGPGGRRRSSNTSVPPTRDILKLSRVLDMIKNSLDAADGNSGRPLTIDDVHCLIFDAWDYAELSSRLEGEKPDSKLDGGEESKLSIEVLKSLGLVRRHSGGQDSSASPVLTDAPKFSAEISDFVEVDRSPDSLGAIDSNLSTSEISASGDNCSFAASESLEWDLCGQGRILNSSRRPMEDTFEHLPGRLVDRERDTPENPTDGLVPTPTTPAGSRNEDADDQNRERSPDAPSSHRLRCFLDSPWIRMMLLSFVLYTLSANLFIPGDQTSDQNGSLTLNPSSLPPKTLPTVNAPAGSDGYITWKLDHVTELVARAQFNKRDLRLSEFVSMRNYQVRLGAGTTFSNDDGFVVLWVTAVVLKDDERVWPYEELMQVRMEHDDPLQVKSYEFRTDQEGQWREQTHNERKGLMYRQMQQVTTKRLKFMRFSDYLTFDESVTRGFVKNDSITVGFKLLPWGGRQRRGH